MSRCRKRDYENVCHKDLFSRSSIIFNWMIEWVIFLHGASRVERREKACSGPGRNRKNKQVIKLSASVCWTIISILFWWLIPRVSHCRKLLNAEQSETRSSQRPLLSQSRRRAQKNYAIFFSKKGEQARNEKCLSRNRKRLSAY